MTLHDPRRILLGIFFIGAGIMHFVAPSSYIGIMPRYLPSPALLVALSGVAEIVGGVMALAPSLHFWARIWLILLLIAVFPANVEMLRIYLARGTSLLWLTALWLRLPLQGVLAWWVWTTTRPPNG